MPIIFQNPPEMQKDNLLHEQGLSQNILPKKVRKL